mgnify:CR=1 FL=1
MVLLDEPTTGLDEQTERQALNVLAQWARDKTVVVVTHRLQVLPMVNRVVVVDNGRVVMDGPRDAVIARLQEKKLVIIKAHQLRLHLMKIIRRKMQLKNKKRRVNNMQTSHKKKLIKKI